MCYSTQQSQPEKRWKNKLAETGSAYRVLRRRSASTLPRQPFAMAYETQTGTCVSFGAFNTGNGWEVLKLRPAGFLHTLQKSNHAPETWRRMQEQAPGPAARNTTPLNVTPNAQSRYSLPGIPMIGKQMANSRPISKQITLCPK